MIYRPLKDTCSTKNKHSPAFPNPKNVLELPKGFTIFRITPVKPFVTIIPHAMQQNKLIWWGGIALISAALIVSSIFVIYQSTDLRTVFLCVSVIPSFILSFVVLYFVAKYKQKINEIFYLRKLLSEGHPEQQLVPLNQQQSNQLGLLLFPYLLTLAKMLFKSAQEHSHMDQLFPVVLRNERNERVLFKLEEIEWVRANGNNQEIQTSEGTFKVKHTMKYIEHMLNSKSDRFVKVHRSWIINIDKVRVVAPNWSYVKIREKLISISENGKEQLSFRLFWYNDPRNEHQAQLES